MLSTPVWGVDIKNEAADPLLAPWLRRYAVTGITPQEQSGKGTPNNDAKKMLEKDFLPKYFEIISTVNRIDNIPDIKKPKMRKGEILLNNSTRLDMYSWKYCIFIILSNSYS